MSNSPTAKSPTKCSSSIEKEQNLAFSSVVELGKAIAKTLDQSDFLGRWMAHYIAQQITDAESAEPAERAGKEQAAAESILALWQRRSGLPADQPPMHSFERVFTALDRLAGPQDPWSFYRTFPAHTEPDEEDVISSTLLCLALNLEDSARGAVQALIAEAAATSLDREAEWIRLSANLDEDDERKAIRQLQRLTEQLSGQPENASGMEPLERIHARIARMIEQLTAISDAITQDLSQGPAGDAGHETI
jgi:hypothetical protein